MADKKTTKSKSKAKSKTGSKSKAKKNVKKKPVKKKEDERIAILQQRLSALEEETISIKRELMGDAIAVARIPDSESDFVSFALGKYDAALPLFAINNIYRMVTIDKSVAHPGVLGLINIGGEPILVLDIFDRFDFQLPDFRPEHFIVTFKARNGVFGFVTTSVYDVVTVAGEEFMQPDQIGIENEIVVGGYKRENLTLILDPEQLAGSNL